MLQLLTIIKQHEIELDQLRIWDFYLIFPNEVRANIIFYALRGYFLNWTTEALKCKEIITEVRINDAIITLKRGISESKLRPMSIFWNNYEESKKDSINW